jgi:YD repeat-containing protein
MNPFTSTSLSLFVCLLGSFAASAQTFSYDNVGLITMLDYGNGREIYYTYDLNGNLTRREIMAFTDSVGDGIPDAWRVANFGGNGAATNSQSCATCDPDHDGMSNLAEYLAGTDPNNPNSVFQLTQINTLFALTWTSVPNKVYRVQYKNSLTDPDWFDLPNDITATGTTSQETEPLNSGQTNRFYRIMLLP